MPLNTTLSSSIRRISPAWGRALFIVERKAEEVYLEGRSSWYTSLYTRPGGSLCGLYYNQKASELLLAQDGYRYQDLYPRLPVLYRVQYCSEILEVVPSLSRRSEYPYWYWLYWSFPSCLIIQVWSQEDPLAVALSAGHSTYTWWRTTWRILVYLDSYWLLFTLYLGFPLHF